jgi:hypothetical protein
MRAFVGFVFVYADIIGGLLGIAGSVILAYPLVSEITDRRHWDQLSEFARRHKVAAPVSPEEREAERHVRDHLLNDRLGRSQRNQKVTLWGLIMLVLGFLLMTIAAYERHEEGSGTVESPVRASKGQQNGGSPDLSARM